MGGSSIKMYAVWTAVMHSGGDLFRNWLQATALYTKRACLAQTVQFRFAELVTLLLNQHKLL